MTAPWASLNTAWTGAKPAKVALAGGEYGTLIATPGGRRGSWVLSHDPQGKLFVMVCYDGLPGPVVEIYGRRWEVVFPYRGYTIQAGPTMTPDSVWEFTHPDFDGAPDEPGGACRDPRYGYCATVAECVAEIDEIEAEREAA